MICEERLTVKFIDITPTGRKSSLNFAWNYLNKARMKVIRS